MVKDATVKQNRMMKAMTRIVHPGVGQINAQEGARRDAHRIRYVE
jgi:hypothetical protein